jgi:hypothetical protein
MKKSTKLHGMNYKELQRPSSFGFACILQANNVSDVTMSTSCIYFKMSYYFQEGYSRLYVFSSVPPLSFFDMLLMIRVEYMIFSHSSFFPLVEGFHFLA